MPATDERVRVGDKAVSRVEFDVELLVVGEAKDPERNIARPFFFWVVFESCDADGKMLGEEGLLRIVNLLGDIPAEKLIAAVLQEIAERFPENLSADDVTLMVIRANGRSLDFSFREKSGAFGRFLRTFLRSVNPRADRAPLPDANLANLGGAVIPALGRRWKAPRKNQE